MSAACLCPAGSSTGNIKARFENIAKQKEEEDRKRAEEERARRQAKEKQEQEEAARRTTEAVREPSPVPAASPSPPRSPTPPVQPAEEYQVSSVGSENLRVQFKAPQDVSLIQGLPPVSVSRQTCGC